MFSAMRRFFHPESLATVLALYNGRKDLAPQAIESRILELSHVRSNMPGYRIAFYEMEVLRLRTLETNDLLCLIPELRRQWALTGGQPSSSELAIDDRPALLAEAVFLTTEIAQHRDLQEAFEAGKFSLSFWLGVVLLLALIFTAICVKFVPRDPTLLAVLATGLCGGVVSSGLRVYQMVPGSDIVQSADLLRSYRASLIAKPLLGATFALTLYLLFLSGMVNGTLFPHIQIEGVLHPHFQDFFGGRITGTGSDFATLLVWSFLAGFAERLVPDMLDRIAAKAATPAKETSA